MADVLQQVADECLDTLEKRFPSATANWLWEAACDEVRAEAHPRDSEVHILASVYDRLFPDGRDVGFPAESPTTVELAA